MKIKGKKNIFVYLLIVAMLAGLTGCASKDQVKNWEIVTPSTESSEGDEDNEGTKTAEVLMQTEYQSYEANVQKIAFSIQNMTDVSLEFGLEYSLQYYDGTNWYQVPFVENAAFNEIAVVLQPQETYSQELNFSMFDLSVIDGTYRIVKTIQEKTYYAVFNIGETTVSTSQVSFKDGEVENPEEIITFLNKVDMNMSCFLDIVRYNQQGDPVYQTVSFVKNADGTTYFQVVEDAATGGENIGKTISYYSYLGVADGEIVLSNYTAFEYSHTLYNNAFMEYTDYFLFSCDELENGMELEALIYDMEEKRSDENTGYKVFSPDGNYYLGLPKDANESGMEFVIGSLEGRSSVEDIPRPEDGARVEKVIGIYWNEDSETFVIGYEDEDQQIQEMELNIGDYFETDSLN